MYPASCMVSHTCECRMMSCSLCAMPAHAPWPACTWGAGWVIFQNCPGAGDRGPLLSANNCGRGL